MGVMCCPIHDRNGFYLVWRHLRSAMDGDLSERSIRSVRFEIGVERSIRLAEFWLCDACMLTTDVGGMLPIVENLEDFDPCLDECSALSKPACMGCCNAWHERHPGAERSRVVIRSR